MNAPLQLVLGAAEWLAFFFHYLSLSLLAVGGAIATIPDMHRFLVDNNAWLTEAQFNASIAIAQAAPGPNVLFIALLGWTWHSRRLRHRHRERLQVDPLTTLWTRQHFSEQAAAAE